MAAKRGTRRRYVEGCRCDDCRESNRVYARDLRQHHADGDPVRPASVVAVSAMPEERTGPGPVESGVEAEISGLAAKARPGLAQAALALARIWITPRRSISSRPRRRCWPRCSTSCVRPRRRVVAAGWQW